MATLTTSCRMCNTFSNQESLFSPCECPAAIHRACLTKYHLLDRSNIRSCQDCGFEFVYQCPFGERNWFAFSRALSWAKLNIVFNVFWFGVEVPIVYCIVRFVKEFPADFSGKVFSAGLLGVPALFFGTLNLLGAGFLTEIVKYNQFGAVDVPEHYALRNVNEEELREKKTAMEHVETVLEMLFRYRMPIGVAGIAGFGAAVAYFS
ncbi:hypothetical protein L596_022030 [Steinernema carpocapsae]|uniref:RING-CH-type domain-containing protein n=1 Tax=Steinernema carpocapsae TaxID=34508 RepID=A0A4U5MKL5_STECR|nr:hypothetical protein L596_022030 [Steinernema carpocapsae]